ncbi:MAG: tRNA (cytidine(34)-2'-O)-methyltransferase [Actinomycetota bacterium]|nr:tRNA (cytidine(34)-2'-O)-methyltransferase [Actinomycetota bacterium]
MSAPIAGRMPVLSQPRFQIVLLHPEIPNNTGAIGRTAAATGCRLHIVHPIGFDMGESARRRAGLDYWHLVDCVEHASWKAFVESEGLARARSRVWLYSTRAIRPHWEASFAGGDYLLFGCETTGPPEAVRRWAGEERSVTLPMIDEPAARSLNLANAVCAAVYEGLRQLAIA